MPRVSDEELFLLGVRIDDMRDLDNMLSVIRELQRLRAAAPKRLEIDPLDNTEWAHAWNACVDEFEKAME